MTNALRNISALAGKILPTDTARAAHINQQKIPLHPAIIQTLQNHEPADWVALFWEWPYVALTDPTRLAYSRSAQHLTDDRQTLTAPGKYLKRHFPNLPDNLIAALAKAEQIEEFAFLETPEEMVAALEIAKDVWSCMQGFADDDPETLAGTLNGTDTLDISDSPYSVYSPRLGWKMAVRRTAKHEIKARALVCNNSFVRSYTAPNEAEREKGLRNMADTLLENWLEKQGIRKEYSWQGCKIEAIDARNKCGYLLPYLDGGVNTVAHYRGDFIITSDSPVLTCDCQDGDAKEVGETCTCCGDNTHEDDLHSTEDGVVCEHCYGNHYTYIESTEETINDQHVIHVNGEAYDERNLPEDIVVLANGDYAEIDDVTAIGPHYYLTEDTVKLEEPHEGEEYALRENAWEDAYGDWWHDDVEQITIDGDTYAVHRCEYDELDVVYYEPGTVMETLPSGMTVHPSNQACKQEELL